MKRIRTAAPRTRRERRWPEDLPTDPRDPDVVRAKALARAAGGCEEREADRAGTWPTIPDSPATAAHTFPGRRTHITGTDRWIGSGS